MMNSTSRFGWRAILGLTLLASSTFLPRITHAQSEGNSVVYDSSTCCSYSSAYVDASMWGNTTNKVGFCSILASALGALPSSGGVVDARGVNASNSTMQCVGSTTPWSTLSAAVPATILLPAGKIQINASWVVPNQTRLIGVGPGVTIIQAATNLSAAILQMGSTQTLSGYKFAPCGTTNVCNGIGIESLTLDAHGNTVLYGIENTYAQELSYVKHVDLTGMTGTGLYVASGGQNSGPFNDLTVTMAVNSAECAQISQVNTRGIHGMHCTGDGSGTGIYLDGSNNTVENVYFSALADGIQVGANENAQSNVLFNIRGDGTVTTVISLSTAHTVTDIAMMNAGNGGSGTTIQDSLTGTTLTDPYIGIYAIGRASGGGYSRFTTSQNTANWTVASAAPPSTCSSNLIGSLYTNTGSSGSTLYVCIKPSSSPTWAGVK
jgi:hypothetical protein